MLAIVLPTIAAIFAFAFWFRAVQHRAHSTGPTGSIPAASSSWSGRSRRSPSSCSAASPGSARISSIPPRRSQGTGSPVTDPGRVARLEMAVHLSGPADRDRQHADRAGRRAAAFRADLGKRDERVLHPAARQHDLHHERHGDAAQSARRPGRRSIRACRRISAATAFPTCCSTSTSSRRSDVSRLGRKTAAQRSGPERATATDRLATAIGRERPSRPIGSTIPSCSRRSRPRRFRRVPGRN